MSFQKVDVSKQYANFKNCLKGAQTGSVVTRFPPEPSGYLHIGHVKAAILNYHYAQMYQGKMLLRFDDTNPDKENQDFVDSIMQDLNTLQIKHDSLSYTSDHFEYLKDKMTQLIQEGKMYLDNTVQEVMRDERMKGIESKCRGQTIEQNLALWEGMIKGEHDDYCVRAKIDMKALNKCMRDPVMYRVNRTPHHRTGTTHLVYPTYDYACPLVDSLEGVTHALRTNEYSDRIEQYQWVINAAQIRKVEIYEFSRLNLQHTCLSKRKLNWFVDTKRVEGWNDPRFPTLRGILRRGLTVQTLAEFMLEQGPSKNTNMMEWDKLWAINKKVIDNKAGRYSAITSTKQCILDITNWVSGDDATTITVPLHQQNPSLGDKVQFRSEQVLLEWDDAKDIKQGEKITLMKWANCLIDTITHNTHHIHLTATLLPEDKDFKSTKKVTWLSNKSPLVKVDLVELDHLLKVKKVEENMEFEDALNQQTIYHTPAVAEPTVQSLSIGHVIQFERRGFYILDDIQKDIYKFIYIPDGKTKTMSNLSAQVDVSKFSGSTNNKQKQEDEPKEGEKSKKQLKREKALAEKALKKEQHKKNEIANKEAKKQEESKNEAESKQE